MIYRQPNVIVLPQTDYLLRFAGILQNPGYNEAHMMSHLVQRAAKLLCFSE